MLNQPTYDKLVRMKMSVMADAYRQQMEDPSVAALSFDERLAMLVDAEYWSRHNMSAFTVKCKRSLLGVSAF